MLSDADKRVVEIVAAAFRAKLQEESPENPRAEYGRELLGIERNTPSAGMWWAFWLGFGAGVDFMAEQ